MLPGSAGIPCEYWIFYCLDLLLYHGNSGWGFVCQDLLVHHVTIGYSGAGPTTMPCEYWLDILSSKPAAISFN